MYFLLYIDGVFTLDYYMHTCNGKYLYEQGETFILFHFFIQYDVCDSESAFAFDYNRTKHVIFLPNIVELGRVQHYLVFSFASETQEVGNNILKEFDGQNKNMSMVKWERFRDTLGDALRNKNFGLSELWPADVRLVL